MTTNMVADSSGDQDPWTKVDEENVVSILARLPTADLLRCQFVCLRWFSAIFCPTFEKVSKELCNRLPWFSMISSQLPSNAVYDMEVDCWRHISLSMPTEDGIPSKPLAASNSYMCCISGNHTLYVCNPVNGSARDIGCFAGFVCFKAIAMYACGSSYNVCIVCWMPGCLYMLMFSSIYNCWREFALQVRTVEKNPNPTQGRNFKVSLVDLFHDQMLAPVCAMHFDLIPAKGLPSVATLDCFGNLVVYYLEPSCRLVGCYTDEPLAFIYPPIPGEFSTVKLAECHGRILNLTLAEDDETKMIQVWEFNHEDAEWKKIATLPPEMTEVYDGINLEIDCSGCGDYVMICMRSREYDFSNVVMWNIAENTWKELPRCVEPGSGQEKGFVSALSFMPNMNDRA